MDLATTVRLSNIAALAVVMLALGMRVQPSAILVAARRLRLTALAVVVNFLIVPLITVLLVRAFHAAPDAALGFMILAACPGAPVGPLFAKLAGGDVALATGWMIILASLSAIAAPALLVFFSTTSAENMPIINYRAVVMVLLGTQLLPLAIGLAIGRWAPAVASRIARPATALGNLLLAAVLLLVVATQYRVFEAFRLRGWFGMVLLLFGSLVAAWTLAGGDAAVRRTLVATTGPRNAAVGLVIVSTSLADTTATPAVVAYALVSIVGTLCCTPLFARQAARGIAASG
jgi:BASS family bile acid:Na+ symporter